MFTAQRDTAVRTQTDGVAGIRRYLGLIKHQAECLNGSLPLQQLCLVGLSTKPEQPRDFRSLELCQALLRRADEVRYGAGCSGINLYEIWQLPETNTFLSLWKLIVLIVKPIALRSVKPIEFQNKDHHYYCIC